MRLDSLHIQNYKLFKDLEIPKLGQVNLITGKNNTGKTILLEALRIWASEGDASVVNNIIWKRGDWDPGSALRTFSSLFSEQRISKLNGITHIEYQYVSGEIFINNIQLIVNEDNTKKIDFYVRTQGFRPKDDVLINYWGLDRGDKEYPQDKAIFIPASIDFDNKKLWSNIDLTDKKDRVIQILQIIEPSIIDIGIIDNTARVRTKNSKIPVSLKNFGEGLNRLLTIAMALVSAKDNLLLIDEIDTGLHYSVLEKLWEIIFEFSGQLNTQVFVTTHSADCVSAFSTIANREKWHGKSNYLRLSRKEDNIIAVEYDIEELEMALESNIETR